jgi:uncharacterized protein YbjQ (UPF0145 family)
MSDPSAPATAYAQFPITTEREFPEWGIERSVGMVFGVVVYSLGSVAKLTGGLKAGAGAGEIDQFSRVMDDARRKSVGRLIQQAQNLGANAVVGFQFGGSDMGASMSEIVAYGTGVVLGHKK